MIFPPAMMGANRPKTTSKVTQTLVRFTHLMTFCWREDKTLTETSLFLFIAAKYKTYARLRAVEGAKPAAPLTEDKSRELPRHTDSSSLRRTLFQSELQAKSRAASPVRGQSLGRDTIIRSLRENDEPAVSTPRKPKQDRSVFETPRRNGSHPADVDPYVSPAAIRHLLSPNPHARTPVAPSPVPLRDMLGPTPTRDGKPLGLFDLLSSSTKSPNTPAKRRLADIDEALTTPTSKSHKPDAISTLTTPMKDTSIADETNLSTPRPRHKHSPSPVPSAKRFYLANFFATPTTRHQLAAESLDPNEEPLGSLGMTPSRPGDSGTPSFLRRRNPAGNARSAAAASDPADDDKKQQEAHHTGDNSDTTRSPTGIRRSPNKKLFGKRLSILVKELRDMEDEKHDDDLHLLRDMEYDNDVGNDATDDKPKRDGEKAAPEQPRKKKGAKRTTRRVNIKPVRAKPRNQEATPEWQVYDEEGEQQVQQQPSGSGNEDELASVAITVPKNRTSKRTTKLQSATADTPDTQDGDEASVSEYEDIPDVASDDDSGDGAPKSTKHQATAPATKKGKALSSSIKPGKQPRKINSEAHANYRSLKIQRKKPPNRRQGRF